MIGLVVGLLSGLVFGFLFGFLYAEEQMRSNKDFMKQVFERRNEQENGLTEKEEDNNGDF